MKQTFNVSIRLCGWLILALGGVMIGASVALGWADHGNGGLFLGMLGGIIAMRSYICEAVHAGRAWGRAERQGDWQDAFEMGREVGQEYGGRVRPMR